jgi:hypothetical protein
VGGGREGGQISNRKKKNTPVLNTLVLNTPVLNKSLLTQLKLWKEETKMTRGNVLLWVKV